MTGIICLHTLRRRPLSTLLKTNCMTASRTWMVKKLRLINISPSTPSTSTPCASTNLDRLANVFLGGELDYAQITSEL